MKISKCKYAFFLFSLFIIFSCSNDDTSEEIPNPRAENLKAIGISADDLLSDETYKSLTVELSFLASFRPRQETIDALRTFLEARVYKPDAITFIETEITIPYTQTQSFAEIKAIEEAQRTIYTEGDDIAVFVYFSQANFENDTQNALTLGAAYYNTSIVIFEQTLRDLVLSQNFDLAQMETTTLHHEFGHLFGLVNLRDDDIHDNHEDPQHSKHCKIENCLMYYESNIANYFINRSTVPGLDPLCIEDLQAKGGR